ncbi:MAG: hypothetical protein G01um101466_35 [Parcubacteria group bacterium Gr01-1014_66]|nr:MAG: hypothetical protein G01um101466_35 [Parcubacteria group bacterium Gr01-1014_66]
MKFPFFHRRHTKKRRSSLYFLLIRTPQRAANFATLAMILILCGMIAWDIFIFFSLRRAREIAQPAISLKNNFGRELDKIIGLLTSREQALNNLIPLYVTPSVATSSRDISDEITPFTDINQSSF